MAWGFLFFYMFILACNQNLPGSVSTDRRPSFYHTHTVSSRGVSVGGCMMSFVIGLTVLMLTLCFYVLSLQVVHGCSWQKATPADFWSSGQAWSQGNATSGAHWPQLRLSLGIKLALLSADVQCLAIEEVVKLLQNIHLTTYWLVYFLFLFTRLFFQCCH